MNPICCRDGEVMDKNLTGIVVYKLSPGNHDHIDWAMNGDRFRCPQCGNEILAAFGKMLFDYDVPQDQLHFMRLNAKEAVELK